MTRSSSCPRCEGRKEATRFACVTCWYLLPLDLRQGIWRAFQHHGVLSAEYDAATSAAHEYWNTYHPVDPQMEIGETR